MRRGGLDPTVITEAAAAVADEVGFAQLSMGLVAQRLGVTTPSLYKHVENLADLGHRIALLTGAELADAIRDAIAGRAGSEALAAGAQAMRTYVRRHPGRYAAGNAARLRGPDDPLGPVIDRVLASWAAMLHGYQLDPDQELHALRMLRSALHGFATLEATGGFQINDETDDSFTWLIDFVDRGLRANAAPRRAGSPPDAQRRTGHG